MTSSLLRRLRAILLALPVYSMASAPMASASCTRTVQVPVLVPRTPCNLPEVPAFPDLSASDCGDKVCLPSDRAAALYLWIRDAQRALEVAHVCLDTDAASFNFLGLYQPKTEVAEVMSWLTFSGRVKVDLVYRDCGQQNAFYSPADRTVTICNELIDEAPGMVPFAAAHEMGHAVVDQLNIPYTGSEEVAADELATIMFLIHDRPGPVLAAAEWFGNGTEDHPWDDHPTGARRGYTAECLVLGASGDPHYRGCEERFFRAANAWFALLSQALS